MIKFSIPVAPKTKKNGMQIIQIKGRNILIPSKQYRQFEKDCLLYLYRVKDTVGVVNYPINLKCIFYTDTKRKIDLPNLLNAIDDAMVKAGLIVDDNRDIIAGHDGSRVYHDKISPRLEIEITEMQDYTQWKDTTTVQQELF